MSAAFALRAPRPRERTAGCGGGGSGPTMDSSGSESDAGVLDRLLVFLVTSGLCDECRGDRD